MSVLMSKRSVSAVQFVDTARDLEIYTLRHIVRFPKRYMFFITTEIARLAQSVYNNVKSANSVFPTNASEAQLRRDYLIKANCELQCLISQLDIAKNLITHMTNNKPIDAKVWQQWLDLIEQEAKLIAAVKKSDKERYASFDNRSCAE